jgi:predicted nucleic acid-binding Zn ribbon protein
MNCPGCDKQISPDQKFCRFCGRSLEAVSTVPSGEAMAKVTKRMPARRMNRVLLWGLIVIGVGVTLLVNSQNYEIVNWLGILVFLAGIGLAIYGAFSPAKARTLPSGQSSQTKALNLSETSSYLPPKDFSEPLPSVTERTTELLEIENTKLSK